MKKALFIVSGAVVFITVLIFVFLGYSGFFYKPFAVEKVMGPYSYAYEDFTGPYSKTFPVFNRVYKTLNDNSIKNTIGIGLYHDDPAVVPADKLRSSCGSVIAEDDVMKAETAGLKTGKIDAKLSVVIEFPVNTSFAYMFAPSKCYPVLVKYASDKGYKLSAPFELYDMPGKKMFVVMEVIK